LFKYFPPYSLGSVPFFRQPDALRTSIPLIVEQLNVSQDIQVVNKVTHGLLRNPGTLSKVYNPETVRRDVPEYAFVGRADVRKASFRKTFVDSGADRF
jgi:hypothetical protein